MHRFALLVVVGLATAFALGATLGHSADAPVNSLSAFIERTGQFPGPRAEHKYLEQFVGEWEAVTRATLGDQAMEMKGSFKARMTCNGTWLLGEMTAEMMGMPYEGVSIMGFDAQNKKYVGTWLDMAKGFLDPMVGEVNEKGHLVSVGPVPNPMMAATRLKARGTFIFRGEDSFEYVEVIDDGNGGWKDWVHTTFARVKGGDHDHGHGEEHGHDNDEHGHHAEGDGHGHGEGHGG